MVSFKVQFEPKTWGAGVAIVGLAAFAVITATIGWHNIAKAPGEVVAAWVQAIGTILALVVAVGLPAWQVERDQRQRKDERLARFLEAYSVSQDIAGAWGRLENVSRPEAIKQPPPSGRQLDDLLNRLRIDTSGMPARFGANLRTLRRLLHDLEHAWAVRESGSPLDYEDIRRDMRTAQRVANSIQDLASRATDGRRLPATWAELGEGAGDLMDPASPGYWERN